LDLKQLRFFVTTVDAGSISYASRLLHITQPALSRQITNLEYDLKVELLCRTHNGVVPTEHGTKLYAMAQKLLRDFNHITETLAEVDNDPVGRVVLGCMDSVANILASRLITALGSKYPKLSLTFYADQTTNLYNKLVANAMDMGIVCNNPEIEGLQTSFILREELMVAVAGQLLRELPEPEISPEQLRELPFIFPPTQFFSAEGTTTLRRLAVKNIAEDVFAGLNIKLRILSEINAVSIVKRMVAGGAYCTISPWSAVYEEVEKGNITLKTIKGSRMFRDIYFCWPKSRPMTKATSTVHQVLMDTIKDLVDSRVWRHVSLDPDE